MTGSRQSAARVRPTANKALETIPKQKRFTVFMARQICPRNNAPAILQTTGFPVVFKFAIALCLSVVHHWNFVSTSGSSPRKATRRALAFLAMGVILLPFAGASQYGFPPITVYSSSDVGTDAVSYSTVQSETGVLFFGSGGRLLSFDGEHWKSIPLKSAYGLKALNFDSSGRLWVGGTGDFGWLDETSERQWNFHSLRPNVAEMDTSLVEMDRVFPDETGAVFVARDKVFRWDGKDVSVWPMPSHPHRLLSFRLDGVVYVQWYPSGLHAIHPSGTQLFLPGSLLEEAGDVGVMWMEPRGNNWFLVTSKGPFLWREDKLEPLAENTAGFLQREILTCAIPLPDGRYALGTLAAGIAILKHDGSLDQILTEQDGLPTRAITSLFVDRDRQLWATSKSNIFRIDLTSGTEIFDQRAGLPAQAYQGIAKLGDAIVVSGENGAYVLPPNHGSTATNVLRESVTDLKLCGDELLAAGFKWVKRLRDGTAKTIYDARRDVLAIQPSRSEAGRIYFSEIDGVSLMIEGGKPRTLVKALPDYARSIAEDASGNLWLGTVNQGVLAARLEGDSEVGATRIDGSIGLPSLEGRSWVRADSNGSILVFADNGGWWKPTNETQFRVIKNYPARDIAAVSDFSADGTGWIAYPESDTNAACTARISISGREARWEPHSIPALPEIGSPRSIFVEATGTTAVNLWIGGTKSVLRHVVKAGPLAPRPRAPLLAGFSRSQESTTRQAIAGSLPYSISSIEFEFAAPEYLRRKSLRLQTRIDGIDSDWQPAAPEALRTLTAVRDGNFTFRVRTVAETGVTSEETVFKFQVLPPWWRSRLALAGEGAAAMLMLWGAYGLRVRSLRRRNDELEQKVRQRTREFEEASAAKTQFVANMSHDIRNPLNGIVGLALALENTRLDRRQRELVATLRECSTYLSSLVDDVLDFASIEAGRVELRPGPFVPQELLRSLVNTLKADADARGALLLVEADPHLPPHILGDAGRIQQILVNFVSNALKYAGGQIRLSVSTPANAFGEIEFAVADEGPGISAEEQSTLFTKFTRVKRAQGPDIPGTGLGLAACRLLADLMGGSVGVESRVGEGARFFLRLPLEIAAAPIEHPAANLPNTTVLVVEDTDYNAWAAEAVLAKLGLACERARTGAEALQMFAARRFNVVLLDRNLPDMDGTEVARRMRAAEAEGPQAVLLAVTAYCTAEDRALCLEAGMDAFVGKPLTPEKLRRVLVEAGRKLLTAASFHVSAESAAPASPQEINLTLLRYLSDGTPESFDAQVQRFLAALGEAGAPLDDALRAADYRNLATGAHSLLGPAKMIGAAAFIEACQQLEAAASLGEHSACEQALQHVRDEIRAVMATMQRHRPAPQST